MSATSLNDDIRKYLNLTIRVVSQHGNYINVGETFTLRFTGSNSAHGTHVYSHHRIVFNNARVFVQGTGYATPVEGAAWHELPDQKMYPGDSSSIDVQFRAERDMGGTEHVAAAYIYADLDLDNYFTMTNNADAYVNIRPN